MPSLLGKHKTRIIALAIVIGALAGFTPIVVGAAYTSLARPWMNIGYERNQAQALGNMQMAAFVHSKIYNKQWSFIGSGALMRAAKEVINANAQIAEQVLPKNDLVLVSFMRNLSPYYGDSIDDSDPTPRHHELLDLVGMYNQVKHAHFSKVWLNNIGRSYMEVVFLNVVDPFRGYPPDNIFNYIFNSIYQTYQCCVRQRNFFNSESLPFFSQSKELPTRMIHALVSAATDNKRVLGREIFCQSIPRIVPLKDAYVAEVKIQKSFLPANAPKHKDMMQRYNQFAKAWADGEEWRQENCRGE